MKDLFTENYIKTLIKETEEGREQGDGGVDGLEYISLHRYIKNTPSDTEIHAEHQLRVDKST